MTPDKNVEECEHSFQYVRTETIYSPSTSDSSYPYNGKNVDLVICPKCGKTKRV